MTRAQDLARDTAIVAAMAGGPAFVRFGLGSICQGRIRLDHGSFPTDMEIDDGYPEDARVDEIACVSIRDARRWLREVFPHVVNELPCGCAEIEPFVDDFDRPSLRITVATGGWSGVESVVYAVLDHAIMRQYLDAQCSGGKYVFAVPEADP